MRKLAFLSVLVLSGLAFGNAFGGNCSPVNNCNQQGGVGGLAKREILTPSGLTGSNVPTSYSGTCFVCNNSLAGNANCNKSSHRVAIVENNEVTALYKCDIGQVWNGDIYDAWRSVSLDSVTEICGDSPLIKSDISGSKISYREGSGLTASSALQASQYIYSSRSVSSLCKYIECDSNHAPSADKQSCVEINKDCELSDGKFASTNHTENKFKCNPNKTASGLTDSAHVKSGDVCNAKCTSGGWDVKLNEGACEKDWVVDTTTYKKCVEDPAVAQRRADQQRRANASREEKCKDTGGTWASNKCSCSADKGLKKSGDECVCIDDTYEPNPDGKSCKLKDIEAQKQACAAAASSGAYWENNRCKCQDTDKIWRNNTCMENTEIARCKSANGTKWDYNTSECVCKDSGYDYDKGNNECVETDDARKKREEAEEAAHQKAKQEESKANIVSIVGKINNLKSGLNTSVWKNKEGNFNTSRLVSDSVAGVVLGTAGGLITSNVIKKNQIKGGFEDISCTVRGQVVAGYGDEFQVGIQ